MKRLNLLIVATMFILLLTGCAKKLDPANYCTVTYDGINTKATATVSIDYEKLTSDALGEEPSNEADLVNQSKGTLANAIDIALGKNSELSNGDKIRYGNLIFLPTHGKLR